MPAVLLLSLSLLASAARPDSSIYTSTLTTERPTVAEDDVEIPVGLSVDDEMEEAKDSDESASWARKTLGTLHTFIGAE